MYLFGHCCDRNPEMNQNAKHRRIFCIMFRYNPLKSEVREFFSCGFNFHFLSFSPHIFLLSFMLQTSETSILLKECSHWQFVHLEHQRKGRFAVSDPSFNIIFLSK